MKTHLAVYGAFCATKSFEINGVHAVMEDFGSKWDHDPDNAEDYGCGDMRLVRHRTIPDGVLERYSISSKEWHEIAEQLEEKLSFGECGWCT